MKTLFVILFFLNSSVFAKVDLINDKSGVALNGYDVVAYFANAEKGLEKGTKGSPQFKSVKEGTTYLFHTAENKAKFDENPEAYLPAYGGWCAWAVADGKLNVPVNYDTFLVKEDLKGQKRLYLFYNKWFTNTLDKWNAGNHKELLQKAETEWAKGSN